MLAVHLEILFGTNMIAAALCPPGRSGLADTTRLLHPIRRCTSSSLYPALSGTPQAAQRPVLPHETRDQFMALAVAWLFGHLLVVRLLDADDQCGTCDTAFFLVTYLLRSREKLLIWDLFHGSALVRSQVRRMTQQRIPGQTRLRMKCATRREHLKRMCPDACSKEMGCHHVTYPSTQRNCGTGRFSFVTAGHFINLGVRNFVPRCFSLFSPPLRFQDRPTVRFVNA